jgi:hypothetical protein
MAVTMTAEYGAFVSFASAKAANIQVGMDTTGMN